MARLRVEHPLGSGDGWYAYDPNNRDRRDDPDRSQSTGERAGGVPVAPPASGRRGVGRGQGRPGGSGGSASSIRVVPVLSRR